MNDKAEALILAVKDYREYDALVTALTPIGRLNFVAKGLKKATSRNAYALQLFSKSNLLFDLKDKNQLNVLKIAELIESNRNLREDFNTQILAAIASEIGLVLSDEPDLFTLIDQLFTKLNQQQDIYGYFNCFLARILKREGNGPQVDSCVVCNRQRNIVAVSVAQGGFLCQECFGHYDGVQLSPQLLRAFRLINKVPFDSEDSIMNPEVNSIQITNLLIDFMEEYSGITIKARKFLSEIII